MRFYGHLDTNKREETWTSLESLKLSSNLPWLCLGGYNEIVSQMEKHGGCLWPTKQMDRFRLAIHHCGFVDLGFVGSLYTWSQNHLMEGKFFICLDQALIATSWTSLFQGTTIHHLSMSTSNHSMLVVTLPPARHHRPRLKRPFRFEAMWLRYPRCDEVV